MGTQFIGFDMGESAVKIAVVSGTLLKKAVYAELPDNIVRAGEIISMDAMADFIKESAKKAGIGSGAACFTIPDTQVVVRNITMPVMSDSQLKYNLPFEFKDYLNDEKSNYFYDYAVRDIVNDEDGKPSEMTLLACAVLKSTINDYRAMFRRAGFKLKKAVPAVYAVEKYIENVSDFEKDMAYALVDIGHASTKIYFYNEDRLDSNRTVDYGLAGLERKIADAEDVDIHIAHKYLESNFNNVLESDMAKEEFNNMALEIMKVVNFFNYNNREAVLDTLHVAGGGALIGGLCDTIGSVIDIDVKAAGGSIQTGIEDPQLYVPAVGCTL